MIQTPPLRGYAHNHSHTHTQSASQPPMATASARSLFRSTAATTASSRLGAAFASKPQTKPSILQSPFRLPNQRPNSPCSRIFRFPVEMTCCVESLLPYHSATASALLNSMLSATPRRFGWTLEDTKKPLLSTARRSHGGLNSSLSVKGTKLLDYVSPL